MLTLATSRGLGHAQAVRLGELLFAESLARIHWTSPDEEREAFAHFKRHDDKRYSFVDCLSFVVMEKLGIREALTLDAHFTHWCARYGRQGRVSRTDGRGSAARARSEATFDQPRI